MKKSARIGTCVILALALIGFGLFGLAHNYLNSPGFQKRVLSEMARRLQCEVRLEKMKIRILRGADLINIHVASDDFRPREFMRAERLRLRYDLYEALFHRKIVLEELKLSIPQIEVDLMEPPPSAPTAPPAAATPQPDESQAVAPAPIVPDPTLPQTAPAKTPRRPAAEPEPRWPAPPSVNLRSFLVEDGSVAIRLPDGDFLQVHGAQMRAAFSADPVPSGSGSMLCKTVDLPKKIKLSEANIHFLWREDSLTVPKLTAHFYGGSIEGSFKANQSRKEMPFECQISAMNLAMSDLLRLMGAQGTDLNQGEIQGQLRAQARFDGSLLRPEMTSGLGQIRIQEGRLVNIPALALIGGFLNRADFRDLPLNKCEMDFILESGKLKISRFETLSTDIELTGQGQIHLLEQTQDFQMKLFLSGPLSSKIPPEVLVGLNRRKDGYVEVPFRVWGGLSHPQTDLVERFSKLAVQAYGGAIFDKIFQTVPSTTSP